MKTIHINRCTYKDHPQACPKCKHFEEEEGSQFGWGQCQFNKGDKAQAGYVQTQHNPMVNGVDTCCYFEKVTP